MRLTIGQGALMFFRILLCFLLASSFAIAEANSVLVDAVKNNDHETALHLIKQGTDVNQTEIDGSCALLWAAHNEDVELVKSLLRADADVAKANDYGASPLMEAASVGNAEIIKLLLKAGADPNSKNPEGQTALMSVARTGKLDAAKELLKRGADVNVREGWGGQTALMWAAAQQQVGMIKLLIKHGADVNARATERDWERRVTAEPRIKELHAGGLTPLLYAARAGCVDCAKQLAANGADINLSDPYGVTPLIIALLNFNYDTAKYLIEAGADVNRWDWWGRTPLYTAIDMNMIPRGARPDLPSLDTATGIDIARMLLERGANPNFQLKLRPPLRNIVFDRGADVMLSAGATPLLRAARSADVDAIKLLLQYNALIDLDNTEGVTPIMAAAWKGGTRGKFKTEQQAAAALKLLVEAGGDINQTDKFGRTALHGATRQGWNDVVRSLAMLGADLQAKDINGLTPYDYATGKADKVEFGNFDVVGELPETKAVLEQLLAANSAN